MAFGVLWCQSNINCSVASRKCSSKQDLWIMGKTNWSYIFMCFWAWRESPSDLLIENQRNYVIFRNTCCATFIVIVFNFSLCVKWWKSEKGNNRNNVVIAIAFFSIVDIYECYTNAKALINEGFRCNNFINRKLCFIVKFVHWIHGIRKHQNGRAQWISGGDRLCRENEHARPAEAREKAKKSAA